MTNSNLKAQTLVAHYKFDRNLNDETTIYNPSETNVFPTPAASAYEAGHLIETLGGVNGY